MKTLKIDGREVSFSNERNLLEVIRKANIEIPTFCYHSELSIYGACRLCLVNIEGRGINTSCTLAPEEGMVVYTNTEQLRNIRKTTIELLLSSYNHDCTTCTKSMNCKLQDIARRLGVTKVRFKKNERDIRPIDNSSLAITRDPNKCILCGDCVRACEEIQGIGAIDFAYRGADTQVLPAFNKGLATVDCVDCGQCSRVCPTGAIVPRSQVNEVWKELDNPKKVVIAHFAPAVRVAIGEEFDMPIGSVLPGQIVSALRMLGFDKVYDTSFTSDLTIIE
jgi:NADH-quinone oxidoreductase subunit G